MRLLRIARAPLAACILVTMAAGCRACPPGWVSDPPERQGWIHAAGSSGDVYVEADATALALTRAARAISERLGLDVERRLSVVYADGRLFVEAVGADGPSSALDRLEFLDSTRCDERTWVLVRLPLEEPG